MKHYFKLLNKDRSLQILLLSRHCFAFRQGWDKKALWYVGNSAGKLCEKVGRKNSEMCNKRKKYTSLPSYRCKQEVSYL